MAGVGIDLAFEAFSKVCDFTQNVVNDLTTIRTTEITAIKDVRIQELQNEKNRLDKIYEVKKEDLQNKHEEKMLAMRLEHEKYIVSEQRKIIEKIIDVGSAAYNNKVDFINAQLTSLKEMYSKEVELLEDHIAYTKNEQKQCKDDLDRYVMLSADIKDLLNKKASLDEAYISANAKLTCSLEHIKIDNPFPNVLPAIQNNLNGQNVLIGEK